jgi:hypothetical protein
MSTGLRKIVMEETVIRRIAIRNRLSVLLDIIGRGSSFMIIQDILQAMILPSCSP